MDADKDGHFEGPLPKPGKWQVDIDGTQPKLTTTAEVDVKRVGDEATVEIDLPDTFVYGRVIDPAGKPAAAAEVTLSVLAETVLAKADRDGAFELRAYPAGLVVLAASRPAPQGGEEVSNSYTFQSPDGTPHGPVLLNLRRNRELKGHVLGVSGPIVGATIDAWPPIGGDGLITTARSGIDGRFQLRVPADVSALVAVVSPPGGALKAYSVAIDRTDEIALQVEPEGADLTVDFGKGGEGLKKGLAQGAAFSLWQDGIRMPYASLVRWTEGHGTRFVQGNGVHVAQLAGGTYTACFGMRAIGEQSFDEIAGKARCATGYLAPPAGLELRLP